MTPITHQRPPPQSVVDEDAIGKYNHSSEFMVWLIYLLIAEATDEDAERAANLLNKKRKVNTANGSAVPVASSSPRRQRDEAHDQFDGPHSPSGSFSLGDSATVEAAATRKPKGRREKLPKRVTPKDVSNNAPSTIQSQSPPKRAPKRGRGRPKKIVVSEAEKPQNLEAHDSSETGQENDDTISPILLPASPAKATRSDITPQPSNEEEERPEYGCDLEGISSNEDEEEEDLERDEDRDGSRPELYAFDIDPLHILEELINMSDRVGKKHTELETYEDSVVKTKYSKNGCIRRKTKTLVERLACLSNMYEDLKSSTAKGSRISMHSAYSNTSACFEQLSEDVKVIDRIMVDDVEVGSTSADRSKKILMDVYFIVLPKWLRCIKLAIEARTEDGEMSSKSLREVSHLVRLCLVTLNSALSQKAQPQAIEISKIFRPKATNHSHTFQIRQPAISVRSRLPTLNNQFRRGINTIERRAQEEQEAASAQLSMQLRLEAEEAASSARHEQARIVHVEREKRRIADYEKQEEANARCKREIHRLQREDMKRIHLELYGMNRELRTAHKQRSASTKSGRVAHSPSPDLDDANDPFSENYQVVAGVFPANNRRQTERAAWSGKQQDRFIKIMMRGAAGM
jgi:hypothetical protein